MTQAVRNDPITVTGLLFGQGVSAQEALARQILSVQGQVSLDRALARLPRATREAAVREAAAVAAGLLDVNLADLVLAGWRAHRDLAAAARRTLAAPGSSELVDLVDHQITGGQQPSVSVLVDGRQVATLQLGLSLEFDISTLVAGVRAGRLVAVHSGRCEVTGTLAIQGSTVLTKRAHIELPGVIKVGHGIRLLPAEDYPAVPAVPAVPDAGAESPTIPLRYPLAG